MRDEDHDRQRKETATDGAGDKNGKNYNLCWTLIFISNMLLAGAGTVGGGCLFSVKIVSM